MLEAAADNRFAVVIGNEAYPSEIGALNNAHEDAENVALALEESGFNVIGGVRKDANRDEMWSAILQLQNALIEANGNGVGFIYYSGHGGSFETQNTRSNYLIPSNVPALEPHQLPALGINLNDIVAALGSTDSRAIFLVSDACRNTLPWTSDRGGAQPDRGFVPQQAAPRMLLAYATADGETAPDDGEYANSLAKYLRAPGITADRMFTLVGREISQRRDGARFPVVSDRLQEDFCFQGCDRRGMDPSQFPLFEGQVNAGFFTEIPDDAENYSTIDDQSSEFRAFLESNTSEVVRLKLRIYARLPPGADGYLIENDNCYDEIQDRAGRWNPSFTLDRQFSGNLEEYQRIEFIPRNNQTDCKNWVIFDTAQGISRWGASFVGSEFTLDGLYLVDIYSWRGTPAFQLVRQ